MPLISFEILGFVTGKKYPFRAGNVSDPMLDIPGSLSFIVHRALLQIELHIFLRRSIASCDAGLVGGFFNTVGDGFGDSFVED